MKTTLAILVYATLTACSTSEMVDLAKTECDKIGYDVGSHEHTACVERGYRTRNAQQDAVIGAAGTYGILSLIY